jgi:ABC-type enterochelin transport system permease subunit
MRNKTTRTVLIIASIAFCIAGMIAGSIITDRNFAPGSPWPNVWAGIGIVSFVILAAAWVAWWNKK